MMDSLLNRHIWGLKMNGLDCFWLMMLLKRLWEMQGLDVFACCCGNWWRLSFRHSIPLPLKILLSIRHPLPLAPTNQLPKQRHPTLPPSYSPLLLIPEKFLQHLHLRNPLLRIPDPTFKLNPLINRFPRLIMQPIIQVVYFLQHGLGLSLVLFYGEVVVVKQK